jgi:hypothetical protein
MDFVRAFYPTQKKILALFLLIASAVYCPQLKAQEASGMTGVVTDTSGAVVPNCPVALTNKAIGLKLSQTTNAAGSYRFSEIPPGQGYEAVFTCSGFSPLDVKDIYLTVASIRTQNATLTIGTNVQVEVTASSSEVTIDTSDATVGNTFDVKLLNNLPVQQRNDPTALFTMQPGVTDTASVTGARSDQNNITVDGLDVNDFATGGSVQNNSGVQQNFSIVGHAPVDSVEEFHATVAGLGAGSGVASGGQFQLVTKSGTNAFHGNLNEYHRDPSLVADSWFNNDATPIVPRNHLIQNQFGGNIGGPIMKNKLFFFFDYNNSRIIASDTTNRTVPLDSLRNGIVSYINSSGGTGTLTPTQVKTMDPAGIGEDQTWVTGFNARFPHSNASGGDGVNSGGYTFNAPDNNDETNYIGRGDYTLNSNMKVFARFTIARQNATNIVNEFSGDPATDNQVDRTYAFVIGHTWTIGSNKTNQLILGETVQKLNYPNSFNPDGTSWLAFGDGTGPSLTSTLYLNPNVQSRRIPIPVLGDDFTWSKGNHTWQLGGNFKDILSHNYNASDYNAVQVGMGGHILDLCGPVVPVTPPATPACGTTAGVPNPSLRPADINTTPNVGATADYTYDQAFTFMLARIGEVSAQYNYNLSGNALPQLTGDSRFYRYYETQLYAADSWKVLPNLTLSYGVTYQLFSVPYETRGYESTETMSLNNYFGARVAQSAAGKSGPNAVPLINYVLGGKANNGPPLYQPDHHDFAPHVAFAWNPDFDKKTVFNGSIGIVYDRTIINAVQSLQDQYSYLFQQTKPYDAGIPGDPYDSIGTDPRLDSNNQISKASAFFAAPASPKAPYPPFDSAAACAGTDYGAPCGLQLGSAFNETIDPALKTPYSIAFNGGAQRQMGGDMVLKVSYAGRLGRRLLAQSDVNQIIDFKDPVSGQYLSQAFANITQEARSGAAFTNQPWFENMMSCAITGATSCQETQFVVNNVGGLVYNGDFADTAQFLSNFVPQNVANAAQFSENTFHGNQGFSTYHALLVTLQKNLSHGIQYDFNYTFSHSIDNISFFANSQGDTGIGGIGLVCDILRPRECRADSDFDVRQYVTGDVTYELPFGKSKMFFGNSPIWLNEAIGGWAISGITEWHTGQAWGTVSNAFVASYSNDAPGILVGPKNDVKTVLTKLPGGGVNNFEAVVPSSTQPFYAPLAAQAFTGPVGFQIGARNSFHGPHFFNEDLGLAKTFPIIGERLNAKFRADAFNAFNHPNFALPIENSFNGFDAQDVINPTFGQITNTITPSGNLNSGARVLQVSLRLEF